VKSDVSKVVGIPVKSGRGLPHSKTLARETMACESREASWSAPALGALARAIIASKSPAPLSAAFYSKTFKSQPVNGEPNQSLMACPIVHSTIN
jgi:hypothetical protein